MKSWRNVARPHEDVLKGTFQQAEFAVDLNAVYRGGGTNDYKDPISFFKRTYITKGMEQLLSQVARRLSGGDGDPVIHLQTAFGGGKTHTMLAVFHLATRKSELSSLMGIPELLKKAGVTSLPEAKVAVIDGTALSPGQAWVRGKNSIKTLWGELAWQLGGDDGFAMVKDADANGTSPGKEVLETLLKKHSPCVILIDELVAYVRQFQDGKTLSGGTFDSNLSFAQALTEAVKGVPHAVILASLPESEIEAGSERGVAALKALGKIFNRVQALSKLVEAEEAFEIVRRRLFEPITDHKARDEVCTAYSQTYAREGRFLPPETQEARYFHRLKDAYPIHPEVFDRLYEDWTTIEGFQRTRGVLKLMAKVISRLWAEGNLDPLIMPGSLPLADAGVRSEMTNLFAPGWDTVVDRDIDGDRADTTLLETSEPRFGEMNAAKRVARTLFLGTAPASVGAVKGQKGLSQARVILGCLKPGEAPSVYSDALYRLSERLHYLNSTGGGENIRYWFDTRANLRREMEERKRRFEEKLEVDRRIEEVLKKVFSGSTLFDGIHVFPEDSEIPDDSALRLVVLPPEAWFLKEARRQVDEAVLSRLKRCGDRPRHRGNRLLFVAPDNGVLNRLRDSVRTVLAWGSIVKDIDEGRLNSDLSQRRQAEGELEQAAEILPRVARECFKWLLCPVQEDATDPTISIEAHSISTSGGSAMSELERICKDNELVYSVWSEHHLKSLLKEYYWKPDQPEVLAREIWEASLKYVYLPRFKGIDVFEAVIRRGSGSADFFGAAQGKEGAKYLDFNFGQGGVSYSNALLLIEPETARAYAATVVRPGAPTPQPGPDTGGGAPTTPITGLPSGGDGGTATGGALGGIGPAGSARFYRGTIKVNAETARSHLLQISEEILQYLIRDPQAVLTLSLDIETEFPEGASDQLKRIISENARQLGFIRSEWE
jgi:hypothetical protein